MELIRTGLRDKLPQGLSYPLGAELISNALAGVPRYDELWIAFGRTGWASPRIDDSNKEDLFVGAFAAVLNSNSGGAYVSVSAVPSTYRQAVRKALVDCGLPAMRAWLCAPRPQTWFEGLRVFEVGVALDTGAVCLLEKKNGEVSSWKIVLQSE